MSEENIHLDVNDGNTERRGSRRGSRRNSRRNSSRRSTSRRGSRRNSRRENGSDDEPTPKRTSKIKKKRKASTSSSDSSAEAIGLDNVGTKTRRNKTLAQELEDSDNEKPGEVYEITDAENSVKVSKMLCCGLIPDIFDVVTDWFALVALLGTGEIEQVIGRCDNLEPLRISGADTLKEWYVVEGLWAAAIIGTLCTIWKIAVTRSAIRDGVISKEEYAKVSMPEIISLIFEDAVSVFMYMILLSVKGFEEDNRDTERAEGTLANIPLVEISLAVTLLGALWKLYEAYSYWRTTGRGKLLFLLSLAACVVIFAVAAIQASLSGGEYSSELNNEFKEETSIIKGFLNSAKDTDARSGLSFTIGVELYEARTTTWLTETEDSIGFTQTDNDLKTVFGNNWGAPFHSEYCNDSLTQGVTKLNGGTSFVIKYNHNYLWDNFTSIKDARKHVYTVHPANLTGIGIHVGLVVNNFNDKDDDGKETLQQKDLLSFYPVIYQTTPLLPNAGIPSQTILRNLALPKPQFANGEKEEYWVTLGGVYDTNTPSLENGNLFTCDSFPNNGNVTVLYAKVTATAIPCRCNPEWYPDKETNPCRHLSI